ncbi:MAG: serine/threonine-protein kinase, partial [Acidobacteriota bacterium]
MAIKIATTRLLYDAIARFTAERQLLARLEHPSIARLYDGGTTPEGVPYLVMELVEGEPIDRYCDRHRLSLDARLKLLVGVLSAVEYAHRHLIVHRDLKPQNILVTEDRRVKLLDFGIATILEPSQEGTTSNHRLMTPRFASPEQMLGAPTNTYSDIYSMGAVAYELLTGQSPHPTGTSSRERLRTAKLTEEPQAPSLCLDSLPSSRLEQLAERRSSSIPRLRRRLRGDLDAIVLKALQKHPEARYPSAESFSADVIRNLERRPVQVRSSSRTYRTQMLIRRHATMFSILLVACLALAGMSFAFTISSNRTSRQQDLVESQRLQTQEVSDVVIGLARSVEARTFTT